MQGKLGISLRPQKTFMKIDRRQNRYLKRRKLVGGGLKVLKADRLEPLVAVGRAVEEVIGVLALVVHPRRTRS